MRELPLPPPVTICVTHFILNGVPIFPSGFVPHVQIMVAPCQGVTTRVLYNSAWLSSSEPYWPEDGAIILSVRAALGGAVAAPRCCDMSY